MLGSVACVVGLPLTIYWGVQSTAPMLFTAVSYLLGFGVYATAVQVFRPGSPGLVMARLLSAMRLRYLLSLAVLDSSWFLFAAAIAVAPAAVVTILFELWPVLFAVICLSRWWRGRMHDGEALDRSVAASTLTFMAVGIAGVSLAVLSDTGSQSWSWQATVGVVMASLAAAAVAAGAAVAQMIGRHQMHGICEEPADVSAAGTVLSRGLLGGAMLVVLVVWRLAGGPLDVSWAGLGWAAATAALLTGGMWLHHRALHLAREAGGQSAPQINSLYYLVPVGAVVLLAWLADSTVARPDLLICGVAGVVAVNMVMHLDPEGASQRAVRAGGHGYQAIVLALWVCGTLVLLRDDWLPTGWQVWSLVEYWGMIGVFATVFTLMLSFRQSRLAERRMEMDRLFVGLHRRVEHLGRSGVLSKWVALTATARLRRIDTATTPRVLSVQYLRLRRTLVTEMDTGRDDGDREHVSRLLADVEIFVNLRQQARNFAELAVLAMLAAVTVALAVAARPEATSTAFASFAQDTAALVIAAVFAFLGFDLIDKRREADAPLFRRVSRQAADLHGQPPGWRLEMVAYSDQQTERVLAVLLGAVMLVGAVVMLGAKWL